MAFKWQSFCRTWNVCLVFTKEHQMKIIIDWCTQILLCPSTVQQTSGDFKSSLKLVRRNSWMMELSGNGVGLEPMLRYALNKYSVNLNPWKERERQSSNICFCQQGSISFIGPGHLVVWIADLQLLSGDCMVCASKSLARKIEVEGPASATLNSLLIWLDILKYLWMFLFALISRRTLTMEYPYTWIFFSWASCLILPPPTHSQSRSPLLSSSSETLS